MTQHNRRELIQDVIEALDADGVRYQIVPPESCEDAVRWLDNLPETPLGRTDWTRVPSAACRPWATTEQLVRSFEELWRQHNLGNPVVTVIWGNALSPCLNLELAAALRHAAAIFEADFDTWIICPPEGWHIEVYHGGTICFGRVPDQARTGSRPIA